MYNRYGEESPLLEALTTQQILDTNLDELASLPSSLLEYQQTIAYTGSMPLEELVEVLRSKYPVQGELQTTPQYRFRTARSVEETELKNSGKHEHSPTPLRLDIRKAADKTLKI